MIKITLPDNSVREFEGEVTGNDIAQSISSRLAKEVLSISVDGEVWDLGRTIKKDSNIKLLLWDDREGKETFWHSSAHLMAEAIESIYPGTQFGIGPTVDNGFYYDIDINTQLTEDHLKLIEDKMIDFSQEWRDFEDDRGGSHHTLQSRIIQHLKRDRL